MWKTLQVGPVQTGVEQVKFAPGPQIGQHIRDDQWQEGELMN